MPKQNVFYAPRVQDPDLSVLIPMYNEQIILYNTLNTLDKVLPKCSKALEIILIDDNSKDKTLELALKRREKDIHLGVAAYAKGPSRRENLCLSFPLTRASRILLLDMDLAMNVAYIPIMLRKLEEGYVLVAASRYAPGSRVIRSRKRYIVSRCYNFLIRLLFRTNIYDNCCGFKAFDRETALTLVNELGIDESSNRGVFWDTELLIRARRHGFPIYELPISWVAGKKSEINFKRESKMIPYLISLKKRIEDEEDSGVVKRLPKSPLKR